MEPLISWIKKNKKNLEEIWYERQGQGKKWRGGNTHIRVNLCMGFEGLPCVCMCVLKKAG